MINWKPISEFEKTNGNQCLIVDNSKLLHVEYDAKLDVLMAEMSMYKDGRMKAYKSFHLSDITHFADVPNLETINAKVLSEKSAKPLSQYMEGD